jgi:hypothetical protein
MLASFGLISSRECTGDGSHRVCQAGRHCHEVRDCSGAQEIAGTPITPGFRFAAAEQIRLYGDNQGLPTGQPHWPAPAVEQAPLPMQQKVEPPKADKPKVDAPVDPKKNSPTALSVSRPFTNQ